MAVERKRQLPVVERKVRPLPRKLLSVDKRPPLPPPRVKLPKKPHQLVLRLREVDEQPLLPPPRNRRVVVHRRLPAFPVVKPCKTAQLHMLLVVALLMRELEERRQRGNYLKKDVPLL